MCIASDIQTYSTNRQGIGRRGGSGRQSEPTGARANRQSAIHKGRGVAGGAADCGRGEARPTVGGRQRGGGQPDRNRIGWTNCEKDPPGIGTRQGPKATPPHFRLPPGNAPHIKFQSVNHLDNTPRPGFPWLHSPAMISFRVLFSGHTKISQRVIHSINPHVAPVWRLDTSVDAGPGTVV